MDKDFDYNKNFEVHQSTIVFLEKATEAVNCIEVKNIAEIKALARPPQILIDTM